MSYGSVAETINWCIHSTSPRAVFKCNRDGLESFPSHCVKTQYMIKNDPRYIGSFDCTWPKDELRRRFNAAVMSA